MPVTARVDGRVVPADRLWWPSMNSGRTSAAPPGVFEIEIPWPEFVQRVAPAYRAVVEEMRIDDLLDPDDDLPLRSAGYPPLQELPRHPAALEVAVRVFLWDETMGMLPSSPGAPAFMMNWIDGIHATPSSLVIRGRGYHAAPGFAARS